MKHKHTPQRTCVVCKNKIEKRNLTRLVRTENGVYMDLSGKLSGRGAYVCDAEDCRQKVVESSVLNNALRTIITTEDRERLRTAMS